eukprot:3434281-Rhodomonas_salina.1
MGLRACYAVSGTDIVCAVPAPGRAAGQERVACPLSSYALSGTDIRLALLSPYALSGTSIRLAILSPYALSGTSIRYAPPSFQD